MPKPKRTTWEEDVIGRHLREAEEKRQALIASVKVKDKPRYGRLPKKIGEIVAETGLSGGRAPKATFVLRLDSATGEFIAEHGDTLYVSLTREALQAKMNEVAKAVAAIEWTRYLVIEYVATASPQDSWRSRDEELSPRERRKKGTTIYGVRLTWEIKDFSGEIAIPGQDAVHMVRNVDDKGKPSDAQTTVDSVPANAIVFTEGRLALLKAIADTFTKIDAKLVDLFRGDAESVAAQMDAFAGKKLLPEGK